MRVLVVVDSIWPPAIKVAGISCIYELQKEIAKQNIETHILTSIQSWIEPDYKNWFKQEEKRTSIHFHYVDVRFAEKVCFSPLVLSKISMFPKILKLHSRYKFDIMHNYISTPILFYLIGMYKKILGLKGLATLCTYNTSWIGSPGFSWGIRHVDRVICVTRHMRDLFLDNSNYQEKVAYIPLGLDSDRFKIRRNCTSLKEKLNILNGSKIVLFVGRITKEKGIFVFVKAASLVLKLHPKTIFIIATYGPSGMDRHHNRNKKQILNLIGKNHKSFRLIEGLQDIPLLMNMSDIFVLPQVTPHGTLGYPLTLLEAMASDKQIIASDTPGVNELIINGENGLLFKAGDSHELASCINTLVCDEATRNRIERNIKHNTLEELRIESIAKKVVALYKEVCCEAKNNK